jgi:hypothetical protein
VTHLLEKAGASFLRAFVASLVVLAPGLWLAPNLNGALLLATAGLFSAIAAGLKAVQVFVPQLSLSSYVKVPFGAYLDSFLRGFLGALITSLIGIFVAPELATLKAAVTAALVGALAAGIRAIQGATTQGEVPKPESGLAPQGSGV